MKYQLRLFSFMVMGLFMTLSSCVKDTDIESETTEVAAPILTSDFTVMSWDIDSFKDGSIPSGTKFSSKIMYLEFLNSQNLIEESYKTNFKFKFKNSLEREFKIDVEFLNDSDELKFALHIPVSPGSQNKSTTVETNVIIERPELATFKEATKLVYKISMLTDEKQQSPDNRGMLELQSEASYFMDF